MFINMYLRPSEFGTYQSLLSDLEKVISYQRSHILLGSDEVSPTNCSSSLAKKIFERDLRSLTHSHLAMILSAMSYIGAIEHTENGETIFIAQPIDFYCPSFFRFCEQNLIKQLMFFKKESQLFDVKNDHIYAYKKGYVVYGYLYYFKDSGDYEFVLRELSGFKGKYNGEKQALNIIHFKKYCKRAGIKCVKVLLTNHTENIQPFSKLLQNEGIEIMPCEGAIIKKFKAPNT